MELNPTVINFAQVGFIVPTLGTRPDYLVECIKSIKNAGCQSIFIVGPQTLINEIPELDDLQIHLLQDPGEGLTGAINYGVLNLPNEIEFFGWLGDDDLLAEESILRSLKAFEKVENAVATYGMCQYISSDGLDIFLNKSGRWTAKFMKFLPNLIPQPGSLIKRSSFELIGGVRSTYPLSFDFEMFLNLKQQGKLIFVDQVQGSFRWHPESLSVDQRNQAVKQTSQIRKNSHSFFIRILSFCWEPIIMRATILIGSNINRRIK